MKSISDLMLPAAKKFHDQAEGIIRIGNIPSFLETLQQEQIEHYFGSYWWSLAFSLREAGRDIGYDVKNWTDDKRWSGPDSFQDILVLFNKELVIVYPCGNKKINRDKLIWWLEVLFRAYSLLQVKIAVKERQIALFLGPKSFSWEIHGYTTPFGYVVIRSSLSRASQVFVALHELGHSLIMKIINGVTPQEIEADSKSFWFFLEVLEEGYLSVEAMSLFDVSPHCLLLKSVKDGLTTTMETRLRQATDFLANYQGGRLAYGRIIVDSFFRFISQRAQKNNLDCLLDIYRLILAGTEVKAAIEQTISLAWDNIPAQWTNDIIKEVE